jgi:hypothetical protein
MTTSPPRSGVTLTGEGIELTLVAEGARITSIYDPVRRREWLEAPGAMEATRPFDEGAMGGWDEMMPTISACRYPDGVVDLPDHGELWCRPWRVSQVSDSSATMSIDGEVLDFRFERTITVAERSARLSYRLTTPVDGLWYLWAAHPLFAVKPGTRLVVAGRTRDPDGDAREVVLTRDLAPGESRKYFVTPAEEVATASLVDPDGAAITLRWSRADAPFVGVWLDYGAYARHPVVGIEPTNGADDSLEEALAFRGPVPLTGTRRWSVEVALDDVEEQ